MNGRLADIINNDKFEDMGMKCNLKTQASHTQIMDFKTYTDKR